MLIISRNATSYLPHELKTRIHAVETYRNGNSIEYVCRKYHISRTSLWRWNKKYDIIITTKRTEIPQFLKILVN